MSGVFQKLRLFQRFCQCLNRTFAYKSVYNLENLYPAAKDFYVTHSSQPTVSIIISFNNFFNWFLMALLKALLLCNYMYKSIYMLLISNTVCVIFGIFWLFNKLFSFILLSTFQFVSWNLVKTRINLCIFTTVSWPNAST